MACLGKLNESDQGGLKEEVDGMWFAVWMLGLGMLGGLDKRGR